MYKRLFVKNFCKYPYRWLRWYTVKSDPKTPSQKKQHYGDIFPYKLLTNKQKTPDAIYIANRKIANVIDKLLDPFFKKSPCDTILEMNPGAGYFTHKILDRENQFKKILLMEGMDFFLNNLQEMHSLYPDRVKVKNFDFTLVWKELYQDGQDNGSRVAELLRDVPKKSHTDEPNMIVFGSVGSYSFFKHLIDSIVFQNSILSLGRAEMYYILPPSVYLHLTCNSEFGYMLYRASTIMFQILFEYRFIAQLPRKDFLPTQSEYKQTKGSKLGRILSIDPEYLYLVRIIPRRNIFDFVNAEDLPSLWFFVKQHFFSRSSRIIPSLEKWIPGCGPRLIINRDQSVAAKPLYPDENVRKLPKNSTQCVTLSNLDFYPNINIYTQFGDLSPGQILTLFTVFRKWPEYEESSFLASFENSMLRAATPAEESVEDISDEDNELTAELLNEPIPNKSVSLEPRRIKSQIKRKTVKQT